MVKSIAFTLHGVHDTMQYLQEVVESPLFGYRVELIPSCSVFVSVSYNPHLQAKCM